MPESIAALDKVVFCYDRAEVLHSISFALAKGEVVGLLGPNGAGKTTTPKTVLRSLGMKYWDTFGESYSGGPRWH